jgi:hypothetical protein
VDVVLPAEEYFWFNRTEFNSVEGASLFLAFGSHFGFISRRGHNVLRAIFRPDYWYQSQSGGKSTRIHIHKCSLMAVQNAWLHRCDSYMVEVVLGGLAFSSPQDATPIAAFYFRQPDGRLEKQQEYHLINDRDDIWHLTPAGQTPSSLPTVTYYLGNSTLSATCTTPNATICTVGSFQESGFLTFSIVDAFNKSTVTLRAVDKEWVYGKADDAPSYILREVQDKGDLGAVVVRTAVTNLHDCTSLKLCANSANVQTLVPVGLTLLKQNEYSKVCTTPNSN